eukprot:TRINITY_DN16850_c0_g1_i1.p1 TRINITY_DN16850_c0_g1~~TRINITY_DN16850_c0_g1_i1.p1  ORF type:complete len:257 (+),score=54.65 TRINITY_DN16850_c0_g1_i1:85-855(+)
MVQTGEDSNGKAYGTVEELWKEQLKTDGGRKEWYAKATEYWDGQGNDLNGIMGGYPETHDADIRESGRFLDLLGAQASAPGRQRAMDAGAGIGRVSKGVLAGRFAELDLIEPSERLLETAKKDLTAAGRKNDTFVASSLQDFQPEAGRYDVIWLQWVLLYLPDDDLLRFLERCRQALRPNGIVCMKENVVIDGNWVVDREDNSIMRTDEQYRDIFKRAGFELWHELRQACWPPDLFPVMMYAYRPRPSGAASAATS